MIITIQTKEKKKRGIGSLLAAFGAQMHTPEQSLDLAPISDVVTAPGKLFEIVNRIIECGASFEVAAESFEVCAAEILTESEKRFVENNRAEILCHLQQSLLVKHLFSGSSEKFDEFAFDIAERQAIISESEPNSAKVYFAAVREVSKLWFTELLGNRHARS